MRIAKVNSDREGVAKAIFQKGRIFGLKGECDIALTRFDESLQILTELGTRDDVSKCLHQIGVIHFLRGDYETALVKLEESLKISEELGNRPQLAKSHGQRGVLFRATKRFPEAFDQLFLAMMIFAELEFPDVTHAACA